MYEYLDRRYALALYEVAEKEGKAKEYVDELREVVNLVKSNEELSNVAKHSQIATLQKKEIFKSILKGRVNENILSFILILIEKDRIPYLEEKFLEMQKIYLQKKNMLMVDVKTVVPLNKEEKLALIKRLEKKYDKKILLNEKIDKSIIGGIYLKAGNDVIDNTIKLKLEEIRGGIISESYKSIYPREALNLQKHDSLVVIVKTVMPLNDVERSLLIDKLRNAYSKDIILKEEIDESLIGGFYLKVGNLVVDNSIKNKLDEVKKEVILEGKSIYPKENFNASYNSTQIESKALMVVVKTVIPLREDERSSLIDRLKKRYDRDIILKEEIDESLIGGLYIKVGKRVIDISIRSLIDNEKKNLINN